MLKVKKEEIITLPEVKEILEKHKEGVEVKRNLLEYSKEFSLLDAEKAKQLKLELQNLEIIKLKEDLIAQIVNILPKDKEDLLMILQASKYKFEEDEIEKIFNIVKKYSEEK